jgi:CHAT domain-containing protein
VSPGQNDALLFGGIQYEVDSTFLALAKPAETSGDLASRGGLSFAYSDSTLRGGNWNYLRWTDKEVTGLESILKGSGFQTTLRKGLTATEEEFKNIGQGKPSPRVLHLATHGYFFPDSKQNSMEREGLGESEPVFKMSEHPMIRSGLILAGGNHAWKQGKPAREGMEDGILTAYEISQMNLSNTELVVLSACETGLGDIQGNEGVYGLQRAFKIAGAKYLVMSLWQVPDQETSVFMTTFYKNWLEAGGPGKGGNKMTIPDAFRKTQHEIRERFINPYQWAGFVLVE